jgi:hypothetical protein
MSDYFFTNAPGRTRLISGIANGFHQVVVYTDSDNDGYGAMRIGLGFPTQFWFVWRGRGERVGRLQWCRVCVATPSLVPSRGIGRSP